MNDAMIVEQGGYYSYPTTRYEANWYLYWNNIQNFTCEEKNGILYFYIH